MLFRDSVYKEQTALATESHFFHCKLRTNCTDVTF